MTGVENTGDLAMLELFRAELDSHLPVLSEGLLALEKNSDQPKWFEALMRAAHSIKGAARIVGVEGAVRVAHVLEDCFVAAQTRVIRLGPGAVDVLLRGVDVLGSFSQANAPSMTDERLSAVVDAIAALRQQKEPELAPSGPVLVQLPDLVATGCEQLRHQLVEHRQRGATAYHFDFTHVREIEPTALAVLALFAHSPCRDGGAPRIEAVHVRPEVSRVLRLAGLATSWTMPPEQEQRA